MLEQGAGAAAPSVDVVRPPRAGAGTSVETPCTEESDDPSAWILIISAAFRSLQKRARSRLPPP